MSAEEHVHDLKLALSRRIGFARGIARSFAKYTDEFGRLALAHELRELADEIDPGTSLTR